MFRVSSQRKDTNRLIKSDNKLDLLNVLILIYHVKRICSRGKILAINTVHTEVEYNVGYVCMYIFT